MMPHTHNYRVLKTRFVCAHAEYREGEHFTAHPNALLRRAVADGDIEIVKPSPPRKERSEQQ
jgi:hypothetical protein